MENWEEVLSQLLLLCCLLTQEAPARTCQGRQLAFSSKRCSFSHTEEGISENMEKPGGMAGRKKCGSLCAGL